MMISTTKKTFLTILSIFIVFLSWQVLSMIKMDEFLFPSVFQIFKKVGLILTNGNDLVALLTTIYRLTIVILEALLIAFILAFIYFKIPSSIHFFRPIINIIKSAPFAVISIYIFFAFDKNIAPQLVTFLVVLPITFEGLIGAIDNIDHNIQDDLKMLNISSIKKYTNVYLPICFPYIVTTILQSFGLGLKVMIMSEYMCQIENTIGQVLINIKYNYEFDYLLAWLIIIVFIVCIVDLLIRLFSKYINDKKIVK